MSMRKASGPACLLSPRCMDNPAVLNLVTADSRTGILQVMLGWKGAVGWRVKARGLRHGGLIIIQMKGVLCRAQ